MTREGRIETVEVMVDGTPALLRVDLEESPLGWLARRRGREGRPLIAPAQLLAGERLRADFTRGQMTPRMSANWETSGRSGRRGPAAGLNMSEAALAARQRVALSLEVVGPEFSGLLLDVCCFLKGIEQVEQERGWPARTAKVVLGLGLDRLARHYGLSDIAEGPARGQMRGWNAAKGEGG